MESALLVIASPSGARLAAGVHIRVRAVVRGAVVVVVAHVRLRAEEEAAGVVLLDAAVLHAELGRGLRAEVRVLRDERLGARERAAADLDGIRARRLFSPPGRRGRRGADTR